VRTDLQQDRTGPDVVAWRSDQFVEAGFARARAVQLADDAGCDLHVLLELAERGCPLELAVRILAPLDRVGDT